MKSFLSLLACAGAVAAQSLTDVLSQNNATLSELTRLIGSVDGLAEQLSSAQGITILAPNNEAVTRFVSENNATISSDDGIVAAVLSYHVLNGTVRAAQIQNATAPIFARTLLDDDDYESVDGAQYLEAQSAGGNVTFISGLLRNSSVVTPDITFNGGVIHVIDQVLTLPANVTETATAAGLSSLAGTLTKANLLETVNNLENVTIFAPTNQAFQNIASALSNASTEAVTSILTYHVVNSSVIFSTALTDGATVPTVNGGSLTINKEGDNFFVNGALIAQANVLVQNGVVHVIDQVLNPNNATAAPESGASAGSIQFEGATPGAEPPNTSGIPTPTSTIASRPGGTGAPTTSAPASSGAASNLKAAGAYAGAIVAGAAILI